MSCNCSNAKPLPKCISTLILADVVYGSKSYLVYFKTPDGRIDAYPCVDVVYTDLIGVEDIDVRVGTSYEVWIASTVGNDINNKVAFTPIGATSSVTCINIEFVYCESELTYQNVTLQ